MSINRRNAASDFLASYDTDGRLVEGPSEEELERVISTDAVETLLGLWDLIVDAIDQGWHPDEPKGWGEEDSDDLV